MKVFENDKTTKEMYYNNEFWCGAVDTLKYYDKKGLLDDVCDYVDQLVEDCYLDGIDIYLLNDLIWFDLENLFEGAKEDEE